MRPQTFFERFEYKYWVTDEVAAQLLKLAAPYLQSDPWTRGRQRVTSLYLDSPELDFFQLHTESAPDRHKLRVRAYGEPPVGPAFFEIKRKVKRVTIKQRAIVPLAAVPAILRCDLSAAQLKSDEERRTLEHFLYLMLTHRAEPQALMTCHREAFVATDASEDVRVTFDRDMSYQRARGPSLHGDPRGWSHLCGLGNYQALAPTLVEIKFRGTAPAWLDWLVQRLKLTASAYSKYVMAMTFDEQCARGDGEADLAPPAVPGLVRS